MNAPAIHVERLVFAYPDGRQALFGVDFTVERGERVALLGPNGAGKTTLVLHLNGILGSVAGGTDSGRIQIGGTGLHREHLTEVRRKVGLVFQDPDDQLFMPTVRDDVAFGPANLGLRGSELDDRVHEALVQVGMQDHADLAPHHLSFGQRRRVAVATVLAMRSRGYTGRMPLLSVGGATGAQWMHGLAISLIAVVIAVTARVVDL